jgi:uncharacterized protein (TIGR02996 family)
LIAHDEREAFHAAIWKAPDDDLPRLVYADWLDERNEQDAANFLRLLCAVHTCPPDLDRLRPLVAAFRRAMAKVPSSWVEDVCPVPPAVVVGAWVDVDREENRAALRWIQKNRRAGQRDTRRVGTLWPIGAGDTSPDRWGVYERLTVHLPATVPGTVACLIEGVLSLAHTWSGVILAVSLQTSYVIRGPKEDPMAYLFRPMFDTPAAFGAEWSETESPWVWEHHDRELILAGEAGRLRLACAQFDPATRPM